MASGPEYSRRTVQARMDSDFLVSCERIVVARGEVDVPTGNSAEKSRPVPVQRVMPGSSSSWRVRGTEYAKKAAKEGRGRARAAGGMP